MTDFKSQKIKQVLKDLFKKKKLTYEEIAEQLDCSLPTVKRILGSEELTLTRLLQLCEIAEIDLADLELLTKERAVAEEKFTAEQETFLAKNPSYLAYLMKLFGGESPKQIADKHKLTQRSTDKYLVGLEKLGLIHVTGKQKVKPAFKSVPSFGDGPLGRLHFESLITGSAKFFIEVAKDGMRIKAMGGAAKEERPRALWGIHSAKVTRESYDRWVSEQEKTRKDFERLCIFEEKTKSPDELMSTVILGAHTLVRDGYPSLSILENMMGEIRNL